MDSKKRKYGSGGVAVVITPLKKDGRVDGKSLEKIINYSIAGGVHGIFVLGTTGEGTCLIQSEKIKVIKISKKIYS